MMARVAEVSGKVATLLGLAFLAFGVLLTFLSLVVDVPWGHLTGKALLEQSMTIGLLLVAGLLAGLPFMILGRIVLVLVQRANVLERIAQALESRRARSGRSTDLRGIFESVVAAQEIPVRPPPADTAAS